MRDRVFRLPLWKSSSDRECKCQSLATGKLLQELCDLGFWNHQWIWRGGLQTDLECSLFSLWYSKGYVPDFLSSLSWRITDGFLNNHGGWSRTLASTNISKSMFSTSRWGFTRSLIHIFWIQASMPLTPLNFFAPHRISCVGLKVWKLPSSTFLRRVHSRNHLSRLVMLFLTASPPCSYYLVSGTD